MMFIIISIMPRLAMDSEGKVMTARATVNRAWLVDHADREMSVIFIHMRWRWLVGSVRSSSLFLFLSFSFSPFSAAPTHGVWGMGGMTID